MTALLTTNLGATPLLGRGKVRDLYAVGDALLLVATDRISAFDHVLATGIPGKGKILTQISLFWFDLLADLVPNHLITAEVSEFPAVLQPYADQLEGRSMLVKRATMFPVECVARGYLAGSGWKEYQSERNRLRHSAAGGTAGRIAAAGAAVYPLHQGRGRRARREHLLCRRRGARRRGRCRGVAPADAGHLQQGRRHAESRGLILADTKFEFGRTAEGIILADEVLTPDSSRFWEGAAWKPGGAQPSFDKQFVRDYLEAIHWNKQAPAPGLPDDVVERTQDKYLEAFRRLTGRDLICKAQQSASKTERAWLGWIGPSWWLWCWPCWEGLPRDSSAPFCSLGGLVLGLALAAWNYGRVAALLDALGAHRRRWPIPLGFC